MKFCHWSICLPPQALHRVYTGRRIRQRWLRHHGMRIINQIQKKLSQAHVARFNSLIQHGLRLAFTAAQPWTLFFLFNFQEWPCLLSMLFNASNTRSIPRSLNTLWLESLCLKVPASSSSLFRPYLPDESSLLWMTSWHGDWLTNDWFVSENVKYQITNTHKFGEQIGCYCVSDLIQPWFQSFRFRLMTYCFRYETLPSSIL